MSPIVEKSLGHRYLLFFTRLVLGFIFVYASIEKISQPEEFARAIANYHLLPTAAVNLAAVILPWVELLVGLFLILGLLTRASSLLTISLLGLFTIAIAISLARGLDISCGCFGTSSARKVGWSALGEDVAMLAGSLLIFVFPNTFASLENYIRKSLAVLQSNTPRDHVGDSDSGTPTAT
jgi:putative oxidoreductase